MLPRILNSEFGGIKYQIKSNTVYLNWVIEFNIKRNSFKVVRECNDVLSAHLTTSSTEIIYR